MKKFAFVAMILGISQSALAQHPLDCQPKATRAMMALHELNFPEEKHENLKIRGASFEIAEFPGKLQITRVLMLHDDREIKHVAEAVKTAAGECVIMRVDYVPSN